MRSSACCLVAKAKFSSSSVWLSPKDGGSTQDVRSAIGAIGRVFRRRLLLAEQ